MTEIILPILPIAKPRMTQRDRWAHRDCVDRYYAYKDQLKTLMVAADLPPAYHLIFCIPMPASWSKKRHQLMNETPHKQKPDKDNLEKGFLDALFEDDAAIWDGRVTKIWSVEPRIIVRAIAPYTHQK